MKTFSTTESIYWEMRYLRNGEHQTGKVLSYQLMDEARTVVRTGTLTEDATAKLYHFTWPSPGYSSLVRLTLAILEGTRIILDDDIVVSPSASESNAEVLQAIADADRWNDGNAI